MLLARDRAGLPQPRPGPARARGRSGCSSSRRPSAEHTPGGSNLSPPAGAADYGLSTVCQSQWLALAVTVTVTAT